jgi:hypothetical protein
LPLNPLKTAHPTNLSTSPKSPSAPAGPSQPLSYQTHKNQQIMNLKTTQIIYWTGAILTSLWFGASGFFELTRNPIVWDITVQLGYPPHFIYILGVAKLSGIIVLLTPHRLLRLKECIFFDIIFTFFSKTKRT